MAPQSNVSHRMLELLGLRDKDLEVYKAVLRLGSAPLRRIAEEADVNRGTTYDALKRLIDMGLVSYVDAKRHRYFTGEDPHKLRGLATRREVAVREARTMLDEKVIPALNELRLHAGHRPSVRYYEGEAGVREILEDVLKVTERAESKMYRVYSAAGIRDLIADAWPSFSKERIRRGARVRALALGEGGIEAKLAERRWLSQDHSAPTYIFIYEGKTAYVSTDAQEKLFGVIIEDMAIAATQTVIFDALWSTTQ